MNMEAVQPPRPRQAETEAASSHDSISGQNTLVDPAGDEAAQQKTNQPQGIEHRYLTFDTRVPTTPVLPPDPEADLPPCPDLRKYTDPFQWPRQRKLLVTALCCGGNAIAAYGSGAYASPGETLMRKWHISYVAYQTGITIFTAAFGFAPMLLAPFSEINGRRPVFVSTAILFMLCSLFCGITESFGGMLAARFFLGCSSSTFSTMGGGILADIWITEERNTAMTLFTGATLFGTGIGPLVSGIVAEKLLWRWVFYIQVFTSGFFAILVTIFFSESRGSIVLSHKAKVLNKWYAAIEGAGALGVSIPQSSPAPTFDPEKHHTIQDTPTPSTARIRYLVLADEQRASLLTLLRTSLIRPIHMLLTEPVVFFFSLWISFAWSILYLQFSSVPLVFSKTYNFSLAETGYVFTAMSIGGILSTIIGIAQDKWAVKHYPHKFHDPEGRLLFTCIESVLVPIGLFLFGWTCFPHIHWILPVIAVGVMTMGIFTVFLAVFNYSADVYHSYASSALAGIGLCRNWSAGAFPLISHALFNNLGFQGASSLLGGIAAVLTLVPWVLVRWGPRIRARSKIAREFLREAG